MGILESHIPGGNLTLCGGCGREVGRVAVRGDYRKMKSNGLNQEEETQRLAPPAEFCQKQGLEKMCVWSMCTLA